VHRARGGDTLWIDGNIDGFGAIFSHKNHMRGAWRGDLCIECHEAPPTFTDGHLIGDRESDPTCVRCHHMNLPRDANTGCATCHRDMYRPTDAFGHVWHSSRFGADLGCYECHARGEPKVSENAPKCTKCHSDLVAEGSTIEFHHYQAPGYVEAMHNLCITCHNAKAEINGQPDLARCATCHPGQRDFIDRIDLAARHRHLKGKRVVLPLLRE